MLQRMPFSPDHEMLRDAVRRFGETEWCLGTGGGEKGIVDRSRAPISMSVTRIAGGASEVMKQIIGKDLFDRTSARG